ncbi:MAG: RNA methyltransferase [Flavobacteriaceae bacterium]|nr:RNA methyltransferase [Flavobacteriaceae bacterium]
MRDKKLLEYLESYLTDRRKQRFTDVLDRRTRHYTVAIEDIYQLHNTSAVLRSCDIFGIQDVHIIEDKYSDRIDSEIAMGAQKWVDIAKHSSAAECVRYVKSRGYQVVATTPHSDKCTLETFDINPRSCFFFGKEADGLSSEILDQADAFLTIPMHGFTESLNISVSAAIILQHMTSRLRKSVIDWRLTEAEKLDLRLDWCKRSIKSIEQIIERFEDSN